MTEGLSWVSGETSGEPTGTPHEEGGREAWRHVTVVGEPPPLDVVDPDDRGLPWSTGQWFPGGWSREHSSPGEWSQPDRPGPAAPATRRQLRESRAAATTPAADDLGDAPPRAPRFASGRAPWESEDVTPIRQEDPFPRAAEGELAAGLAGSDRPPAWQQARRGPTTAELELYRAPSANSSRTLIRHSAGPPLEAPGAPVADEATGGRFRRGVERWSRWVAGLGLPPRDPYGVRRYPGLERLLPPAVWMVAGLGVAAVAGVLTGILVTQPGADSGTVQTTVATTTVTVTNDTTTTATTTATRTRTRTVTVSPTPQDTGSQPGQPSPPAQNGVQGLGPGSQGPQVFALQQALTQLGLFPGQPNGTYDEQTRAAVQAFQARAGITADPPGVAGPATIAALNHVLGR